MQDVRGREERDMVYKALVGLEYPDKKSQEVINEAGGISKLTKALRSKLKTKAAKAGSSCDDVPVSSLKWLLKQGLIETGKGSTSAKLKATLKK